MSWTQPADVIGSWIGPDAPSDEDQVQIWIDKAEREIKHRVSDVQTRIDAEGAEDPARTELLNNSIDVTVSMVTRVFRNPSGLRQTNETTGPFTTSMTYGGALPGALEITDAEIAKLRGAQTRGAFTVNMIPTSSPYYPES
jgi:hypothetical protein